MPILTAAVRIGILTHVLKTYLIVSRFTGVGFRAARETNPRQTAENARVPPNSFHAPPFFGP